MSWLERRTQERARSNDARSPGDVDYARVIHSASFRRLQGKTQILNLGDSDFYRTRLTHSLEVAQIAGGLVKQLHSNDPKHAAVAFLPEHNLIQAIACTHDLGHPPFGHGGEVALNYCMRADGGFEGNGQTLRILSRLEKFAAGGGSNLTRETLLGVLKYPVCYSQARNALMEPRLLGETSGVPLLDREACKPPKCYLDSETDVVDWKRDATAHDEGAISRKIEIIDARARTSAQAQTKLEMEIARLHGTIESEGGLGLADRAAAAREEAEAAQATLQRVVEEAATIKLLHDMLEAARVETSAKFVGPVAKRAKRYIERLLPDCELTFSEDLALERVARAGVDEQCDVLSQGTQEQLAILTRIAFADLLLEQERPVSLILDDPLVYSDDGRLDTMLEILSDVATRMQVILLTCRDRAFRHVPANRLSLAAKP